MSKLKVYTPDDYRNYNLVSDLKNLFRNISEYRPLLKSLVKVGLTQQYRRSFLGILWLFISPLFSIILWVMLKFTGLLNPGDTKIPYIAYVLISNSLWMFFISFYKSISDTYVGRGRQLLQNNFPHEIIMIEKMIISIINFIIPMSLSIVVLLFSNVTLSWTAILFPFALLPIILFGTALGLLFSVLKIVAVDFTTLFDNSLEILKFITPVVFAANVNNQTLQAIMKYNPLTYLISFPRDLLLNDDFVLLNPFLLCTVLSVLFILFAYRFFKVATPVVFEKISN